ncbi:hypothetical protein E4U60_003109 [Claviceps pazoutovae]|uniref:Uncharacterized protein n=1 Tax=Claviceps pazoutovae TaxID=1649127 RepID=A0A9P7SGR7_9HYPO|nr:hypothetical protein E4U60_003109 [Claviceps pazoutovae]
MFEEKENPAYEKLAHDAAGLIAQWSRNEWYETSAEEVQKVQGQDGQDGQDRQDEEK